MELLHGKTTEEILKAYYNVYNKMGYGFCEKVYENSLVIELRKMGIKCTAQKAIDVYYDEVLVGVYYADIVVEDAVILELKAATGLVPENEAQLLNYIKATKMEVGLLLNFGEKPQFKRIIYTNDRKIVKKAHGLDSSQ